MKRIVICCDGTWNELDYRKRPITNVVKLAQCVAPDGEQDNGPRVGQIVFYDEGVGTLEGESASGGGFGDGLEQNIKDAYAFLVFNYDPGDEIFIFGFSRGAYTARSLAGFIRNCAILRRERAPWIEQAFDLYKGRTHPDSPEAWAFREQNCYPGWWVSDEIREGRDQVSKAQGLDPAKRLCITYMGVWDTVGQLGIPGVFNAIANKEEDHGFHDLKLSSMVKRARHAVAIDENREVFRPALWDPDKLKTLNAESEVGPCYQQLWFPGDHGSVGGGGDLTGLSDIALQWIAEGANANGARLHYDPKFTAVRFDVPLANKKTRTVVFKPDGIAPLKNVSSDYMEGKSPLSRLLGLTMKAVTRDRIADLPAVEDLHPAAKSYAGYDGDDKDYKDKLYARLAGYTSFLKRDLKKALYPEDDPSR